MKSTRLISTILFVVFCIVGCGWSYAHWRPADQDVTSAPKAPVFEGSSLRLRGTLIPPPATAIEGAIQVLEVPVNSWVNKGQIIGKTEEDGEANASLVAEARLRVQRAEAAVAAAQESWRQVSAKLENARTLTDDGQERLVNAEVAATETERTLTQNDRRYRLRLEGELTHDQVLEARRAAKTVGVEPAGVTRATTIELDKGESAASASLAHARERLRLAEGALSDLTRWPRVVPVVAPADGMLVTGDGYRGAFRIVTDLRELVVVAEATAAEAAYLRAGQQAYVLIGKDGGVALHAVVKSVGEAEARGPKDAVYPVTLSASNPRNLFPDGTEVGIAVQASRK